MFTVAPAAPVRRSETAPSCYTCCLCRDMAFLPTPNIRTLAHLHTTQPVFLQAAHGITPSSVVHGGQSDFLVFETKNPST